MDDTKPVADTKPDQRTGFDRRRVDSFLGTNYRLEPPQSLTIQDLRDILDALKTDAGKERAIGLLEVAIALGEKSGRS
jgi:hypothetical protein